LNINRLQLYETFSPNNSINLFNRYGKLVAQILTDGQGWDGTYNSKKLPTDDYWFNIQLIPADTSKSPILKKGHFSLLRR
jgi:gliding motility-associated-like protein